MDTISTILVTGPDAFEFLQGQLSNDLKRLESEADIRAAWCNPKGRVIWFGLVSVTETGYDLLAPTEMANDLVTRLTMFRFRSKVEFEIHDDGITVDPADRIRDGVPFISAEQSEQFTPHMLNLDLLDAISFDKGCYTGQEIVARTHYKGATKRRRLRFESTESVSVGDKVSLDGRDVGEVLNASGTDLLAVIPVEFAAAGLMINGAAITLAAMPYDLAPA
jgi:folate-binding protein YgfZ